MGGGTLLVRKIAHLKVCIYTNSYLLKMFLIRFLGRSVAIKSTDSTNVVAMCTIGIQEEVEDQPRVIERVPGPFCLAVNLVSWLVVQLVSQFVS